MTAPKRAACIGISQQWRAYLTDGNSVTPAQVNSIKIKEESVNLRWPEIGSPFWSPCALLGQQLGLAIECFLGFSECEMSAVGTSADQLDGRCDVGF